MSKQESQDKNREHEGQRGGYRPEKREQPSTYFVQDRENQEELERLRVQDRMITASMGGVLADQAEPESFRRVLDVGSGSGSWAIEAALTYPEMSLIGADISRRMVEYAREQAESAGVSGRVKFEIMDALLMLEFPTSYFDLANMRCAGSFLRTWDWAKILSELLRVVHTGGTVRLTEPEIMHHSNSPAHMQLYEMFQCAMFRSGHLFENETTGLNAPLPRLLTRHDCKQVQTKVYALEYRAGTPEGQAYYENIRYFFRTIRPFLQKWGCLMPEYDTLYQQMLEDMQQSTFSVTWNMRTAWGKKP